MLSAQSIPTAEEAEAILHSALTPEEARQRLRMVVYGKPKQGKTHFAGSFPCPLIFDFDDDGTGILADKRKFPKFNGRVVKIKSWSDVEMWYWVLAQHQHPFQTVVWDTISSAQEKCLQEILAQKGQRGKDVYHADVADYGRVSRVIRAAITAYKQLPLHLLFVAHEREDEPPEGEEGDGLTQWVVPDLTPGLRNYLLSQMSIIGYQYKVQKGDKIGFRMAFDRRGTLAADRYGLLPRKIANPTFDKLMTYYNQTEGDHHGDGGAQALD